MTRPTHYTVPLRENRLPLTSLIALTVLIGGIAVGPAAEILSGSGAVIGAKGEVLTNAARSCLATGVHLHGCTKLPRRFW